MGVALVVLTQQVRSRKLWEEFSASFRTIATVDDGFSSAHLLQCGLAIWPRDLGATAVVVRQRETHTQNSHPQEPRWMQKKYLKRTFALSELPIYKVVIGWYCWVDECLPTPRQAISTCEWGWQRQVSSLYTGKKPRDLQGLCTCVWATTCHCSSKVCVETHHSGFVFTYPTGFWFLVWILLAIKWDLWSTRLHPWQAVNMDFIHKARSPRNSQV